MRPLPGLSQRCLLGIAALLAAFATHPVAASAALTVSIGDEDQFADASSWGRVTSSPAGIDCPGDCDEPFAAGTRVTLTAAATRGYSIAGWAASSTDPGCGQATACEVTVDESGDMTVEAEFHPAAQLHAMPRGAGSLEISPTQGARGSLCDVDFQQEAAGSSCDQRYVTRTRVTLTAHEDPGATFKGWSDYACSNSSQTCTLTLTGDRFIAARFNPVRLQISPGAFGGVSVKPAGGVCALLEDSPLCEFRYPAGKVVKLRRDHGADGQYWVGACLGNTAGLLDADVCRLRLDGDELVAAGANNVTAIPPPLGSGIRVLLGGDKRGKVTGRLINGAQRLRCPPRCSISGGNVTDYDRIYLAASAIGRHHFVRWSDGIRLRKRTVSLEKVNRIRATFASGRR